MTLTLTELFLPHLLREPLQARHDEFDGFILERPALLLIVIEYPRKLMPLPCLFQEVEEPRELLLRRGLAPTRLVFVIREGLHKRRKIGVKVSRLGGAEVRIDRVLGRPRENIEHGRPWLQEFRAKIGDVIQ